MSASLAIDEFAALEAPDHRWRLRYATALSALIVAGILSLFDWPRFEPGRGLLLVVDLLPRERAADEPREAPERPVTPSEAVAEPLAGEQAAEAPPATAAEPAAGGEAADAAAEASREDAAAAPAPAPPVAVPGEVPDAGAAIDWQAALESASASVIREHNEAPASMHPAFDALRQSARERYAAPQTGKPVPLWEQEVELDIYGRKLLWLSDNCYKVLDDTNVGNRYAFETFERHMTFCFFTLGKKPPRKLPWVAEIVARYPYLRHPDGEIPPPAEE